MSGTNQNPYPSCIKCNAELSPQDSRGWEKIETHQTDGGKGPEIWLCLSCISQFQAVRDLDDKLSPAVEYIAKFEHTMQMLGDIIKSVDDKPRG